MIDINVSNQNEITLVEVSGRVDSMTANQFGEALTTQLDAGNVQIVLDLNSVDYMSSAGLREIVSALKKAKKGQGDMRLANPSQPGARSAGDGRTGYDISDFFVTGSRC